jgi:hypothetical protein
VRVSARVRANRANAKKSTGPRTKLGKSASSRNATKHGLSVAPSLLVRLASEVESVARRIAGQGASTQRLCAATEIAEAEFDLMRVRSGRIDLMSDPKAREKWVSRAELAYVNREMCKMTKRVDANERSGKFTPDQIANQSDDVAYFVECALTPEPQTLERGLGVIASALSRICRYERRALTRRRRAIEEFDAIVAEEERAAQLTAAEELKRPPCR